MAVVGVPLGKPHWVQSARAARVSDGEGRTLAAEEMADALDRGLAAGRKRTRYVRHTMGRGPGSVLQERV